jgi:hypothetical protein
VQNSASQTANVAGNKSVKPSKLIRASKDFFFFLVTKQNQKVRYVPDAEHCASSSTAYITRNKSPKTFKAEENLKRI